MAFPIIPSGMFSGQGSTTAPNAFANGTMSSGIQGKKNTNLAYAYDADPNTFAELYNTGLAYNTSGTQTQEALYTHSPATGLLAGSFLYAAINVRANFAAGAGAIMLACPNISLTATVTGNYSDTTPIQSASNPYTILGVNGSNLINAVTGPAKSYSAAFTGKIQIPFDQFSPLTIDIYSLSLSIKWTTDGSSPWNFSGNTLMDARIYDISYIYL